MTSFADERNRLATEIKIGRNLHGKCYMFDTMPFAKNFFDQMKSRNAELNDFIDVRGGEADAQDDCKYVTFEQAIGERAFIVFPSPNYNDEIFDIVQRRGLSIRERLFDFPCGTVTSLRKFKQRDGEREPMIVRFQRLSSATLRLPQ